MATNGTQPWIERLWRIFGDGAVTTDGVVTSDLRALRIRLEDQKSDLFGGIRTSTPQDRLDTEFIYGKMFDLMDEVTNNGTVTHNADSRDLTLALTSATAGSYARMQSHPVPYTPGFANKIDITGVPNLSNIDGRMEVFLRSNVTGTVTEETVPQSQWTALSTGMNWNFSHIFQMDFQSLKVGAIRFAISDGSGRITTVARIDNDNKRDRGFWQSPSVPCGWRIYIEDKGQGDGIQTFAELLYGDDLNGVGFRYVTDGANPAATMRAICVTVKSEGGPRLAEIPFLPRSVSTGTTVQTVGSATALRPLLSIRAKGLYRGFPNLGLALINHYSVFTTQDIRVAIIDGGTLTGASWVDVNADRSMVEYDKSATAVTGGTQLRSDFFAGGGNANKSEAAQLTVTGKAPTWARKGAETGILTLAAVHLGTSSDVRADFGWGEIR